MSKFIPYNDDLHRSQLFELNVEYIRWIADEILERHKINAESMIGRTIREYVGMFFEDFIAIKPPEGIIYVLKIAGEVVGMGAVKKLEDGVGEIKA